VGESPRLEPPVLLAAGPALYGPLADLIARQNG
jgi:hypothetical protein